MGIGIWHKFGLTGGGPTSLDGIAIAELANHDVCHVYAGGIYYYYVFNATATDAEASPTKIRPDDYSTAGVWELGSSPYGDLQVQPEIVAGLPIVGGITGGDITVSGNTLTITPMSCLDSGLTTQLFTEANLTVDLPSVANTIYHIYLVKLVADGSIEFRRYTSEAGVTADAQVDKYRWRTQWRTNAGATCVAGRQTGNILTYGLASENVASTGVTTSFATVDQSALIDASRVRNIEYGARDASAADQAIYASDDGTNTSFICGYTGAVATDTSVNAWGKGGQICGMRPYLATREFRSTSGTLDLLIKQIEVKA